MYFHRSPSCGSPPQKMAHYWQQPSKRLNLPKNGDSVLQVLTDHTEEVWHIQFSRNGRWLASASKDASSILWEVIPGRALSKRHTLRGHTKPLTFCCWSPDDSMIATCSFDGLVKIWEVETGTCLRTIDIHQGATFTAAWHADGMSSNCTCSTAATA